MFTSSYVVSSVRSAQLCKQLSWILKEELVSPVLFHCTPINPPLSWQTSACCRQYWISSCALTWGVMTLHQSENHTLSDHQDRANLFCLSAEFISLAWIQSSANFAFLGVQQCKLVFVSLATCKYVKHCCISLCSPKDRALLATNIFAKCLQFRKMLHPFVFSNCTVAVALQLAVWLNLSSFSERKTTTEIFCFNRLPSTFCTNFFLIFKITSHIQHRWRKGFPAFWGTLAILEIFSSKRGKDSSVFCIRFFTPIKAFCCDVYHCHTMYWISEMSPTIMYSIDIVSLLQASFNFL